MEKINKTKLLSMLVMICTLISFMPTVCKADEKTEDTSSISMEVSYGIEGKFKGSTAMPVNVEIENKGEDIEGQVEVRVPSNVSNTYDAFVAKVNLAAKEKRALTIPINIPENSSKISVVFTKGEDVLNEKKIVLSTGRVNENDMFMGILTDDFNGLSIKDLDFSDLSNKNRKGEINKNVYVPLNLDSLSRSSKNISSLDVITINNYNISSLQKDEYENLSTWINNGGTLIIGSGENASKTIGNIDKEFLNIRYDGTKNTDNYTLASLSLKDASIELQEGENSLIYSINKGKGKVYISTFDLANKNIAANENIMKKWKEILSNDFINKLNSFHGSRGSNYAPYEVDELTSNVPNTENINIKLLIGIFVSYALFVGIIAYFIMKKLNKRQWLWAIIPAVAISISLLLYILGNSTRINDVVLNQANFIVADKNGISLTKAYVGIASKYKDNLTVQEPTGYSVQNYTENNHIRGNSDSNNMTKLGTKTVYRENNSYYEFKDLPALDMKKFELSGNEQVVPKIEASLNYSSQKLEGSIKNTLGYDIEKLLVVSADNVWDLGQVKANEEKQTDMNTYSSNGLEQYGYQLTEDYYKKYRQNSSNKENKEKYKNVERIRALMASVEQLNLQNGSTYLVAITDMPIDYGFDFGKKSVSKYNTTTIIQGVDINFTDKEGNLNYPRGYFKGQVSKISPDIDISNSASEIYGTGEVVIDYLINEKIDILDLKVGYTKNSHSSQLNGSLYIYNYEKGDFEQISYVENGESLKNPTSQYIKDGKVTVKLESNDEKSIGMPQIIVKGRAK